MTVLLRTWLVAGRRGGPEVAWRRSSAAPWPSMTWPRPDAKLSVGGDLVAAEAGAADTGSLKVADVIYRHDDQGCERPLTWLVETLDRYPGCAVAATPGAGGRYLAASSVTGPLTFSFVPNGAGFRALVCAVFVYAWLAAGWPPAALERFPMRASAVLWLPVIGQPGRSEPLPDAVGLGCFDLGVDDKRGGEMISCCVGLAELR